MFPDAVAISLSPVFPPICKIMPLFFCAKTPNSQNSPGNAKSFEIMYRLGSFSTNLQFAAVRISEISGRMRCNMLTMDLTLKYKPSWDIYMYMAHEVLTL
jgi:hypothetical protein